MWFNSEGTGLSKSSSPTAGRGDFQDLAENSSFAASLASPSSPLRFPFSRPELLKAWVLNIGRGDFEPKQHTVICSEHFRPECFSAFGNRKNLKHNAVPTVFAFQDAAQVSTRGAFSLHRRPRGPTGRAWVASTDSRGAGQGLL